MNEQPANQWIQVAAGLKNASMRQLLGEVLAGTQIPAAPSKSQSKDLARWQKIGLLTHEAEQWKINEQFLDRTLQQASAQKPESSGIQRFFTGHKLSTMPAKPADRHAVMLYIRDAVITDGERLREEQLNERLRVFHQDVALLRRFMVDHALLLRAADGSSYQLGPSD
ncbi:DUF2087 domain-containing protein [Glutamicibacter sp. JC586]|uniref:DUF2087 domain-containing protein n=1 Tax=Glutamicibacter sp. JC586 TaxID=2590552 RepID=UPI0013573030|nr:DUF2087 domain-containing protein [Glutamicibacter sp. JC586]